MRLFCLKYAFNLCADIKRQEGSQNCSSGRKKSWQKRPDRLTHTHTYILAFMQETETEICAISQQDNVCW